MYRLALAGLLALVLIDMAAACPPAPSRVTIVDGKPVVEYYCPTGQVLYMHENVYRCFQTCASCPNGFCHEGQCHCFPGTIPPGPGLCGKICPNCQNGWCSSATKCECYAGFVNIYGTCVSGTAPIPRPNPPPNPQPNPAYPSYPSAPNPQPNPPANPQPNPPPNPQPNPAYPSYPSPPCNTVTNTGCVPTGPIPQPNPPPNPQPAYPSYPSRPCNTATNTGCVPTGPVPQPNPPPNPQPAYPSYPSSPCNTATNTGCVPAVAPPTSKPCPNQCSTNSITGCKPQCAKRRRREIRQLNPKPHSYAVFTARRPRLETNPSKIQEASNQSSQPLSQG